MPASERTHRERRFPWFDGEHGGTAVEYALLASLIAAVIAGVVGALGIQVNDLFSTLEDAFQ